MLSCSHPTVSLHGHNHLLFASLHRHPADRTHANTAPAALRLDRKVLGYGKKSSVQSLYSWKAKAFKDQLRKNIFDVSRPLPGSCW